MTAPFEPLAGLRVLDFSQNLAGPFCTQTLGDLGADVTKVEPAAGDPARSWGPPFLDGQATIFLTANRNKRSVALDLKHPDGLAAALRLARGADIVVQSFRAGVADRLGIGYQAVSALNSRVLYLSVTAYGEQGPLRDLPGYDPLMQAHGGLMSVTGWPDRPARVGASVVDVGTGMWAALAVLTALHERTRTGHGRHITASLYETTLTWNAYHLAGWFASGHVPTPQGTQFPLIAPYGAFPTADARPLMIAAANDGLFLRLCRALDLDVLARDPRFASNPERVANRSALDRALEAATRTHALDDLVGILRGAGVPCAPVATMDEVATSPQTEASGLLETTGTLVAPRLPLLWDGQRSHTSRPPPGIGEHTREVLREAGYDDSGIDRILDAGAARQA